MVDGGRSDRNYRLIIDARGLEGIGGGLCAISPSQADKNGRRLKALESFKRRIELRLKGKWRDFILEAAEHGIEA